MSDLPRIRYRLELECRSRLEDADMNLKLALKALLRRFGFRCSSAILVREETKP
jgi:hypothetical protein